jgi:ubiquinone/menaquinone biosynthesis C-methylase UbiE
MMHARTLLIATVPFWPLPMASGAETPGPARTAGVRPSADPDYFQTDRAREQRLSVALVLEGLDLRPNQTVLDLGAGRGYLTLPIAKTLGGTGTVYATDIDAGSVEHLRAVSQREGLTNVAPVLISQGPLDRVYHEHTFDRMVLSHVFEYLDHPVAFLQELRPSLRKGTGRLFVIAPKPVPALSPYHFRSVRAILTVLVSTDATFPIRARLDPDLQAFAHKWNVKNDVPDKYQDLLVNDLKRMLEDPRLYADLSNYYSRPANDRAALFRKLHMEDLELAKWLVVRLDADGAFDKKPADLTETERSGLTFLNQILLTAVFPNGLVRRYNVGNRFMPYLEKRSILARMKAAGYEFLREHDTLHAHFFLEFGRGT